MPAKRIVILTPVHSLWPAFHKALGERLQDDAAPGSEPVCHHRKTMPNTLQALATVGLAPRNALATRRFFREHGLVCDCAVWHSPEILLEDVRPAWEDAEGNFDADAYYWAEIRPYE